MKKQKRSPLHEATLRVVEELATEGHIIWHDDGRIEVLPSLKEHMLEQEAVYAAQARLDAARDSLQTWQYRVNFTRAMPQYYNAEVQRYAIDQFYAALDRVWACQCMMKGTRL